MARGNPAPRFALEQARVRVPLIRDLACEMTQAAAAEKYGVVQQSITAFAQRHRAEIEAARADIADEMAGVWIAEKRARLLAYQEDVELIDAGGEARRLNHMNDRHRALRNSAEELGALKQVVTADVTVRHEIVGVDPDVLR